MNQNTKVQETSGKSKQSLKGKSDAAPVQQPQPASATLLRLQRTIGNQAVLRMLHSPQEEHSAAAATAAPGLGQRPAETEAAIPKDVPPMVREVLNSPGRRLDGGLRAGLESHLGASFGDVIVHTDGKAAQSAGAMGARAYTVGNHIVFGAGQYRPGTPVGDALLAHEAAHVAQQGGGQTRAGHEDVHLEREANAAGMSFAMSMGSFTMRAARGLKSGIRLQRCPAQARLQNPPAYFGRYSRATMNEINRIMSAGASLQNWIAFGNAIAAFDDPLAGMHTPEAAEALRGVPAIIRARVNQEIDFLFLEHENDLNDQEKTFWNDFRRML